MSKSNKIERLTILIKKFLSLLIGQGGLLILTSISIPCFLVGIIAFGCAEIRDDDSILLLGKLKINESRIFHSISALSAILLSIGMAELTVQTLKLLITRRRPNFYALCQLDATTQTCTNNPPSLICEAQYSFPSGHSSLSMCGMTFLCWFLVSHILRRNRRQQQQIQHFYRSLVSVRISILSTVILLIGWAFYVGSTRLIDHWHHYDDVVAGLVLGGVVSTFIFHLSFPPIWHPQVGAPWSILALYQQ